MPGHNLYRVRGRQRAVAKPRTPYPQRSPRPAPSCCGRGPTPAPVLPGQGHSSALQVRLAGIRSGASAGKVPCQPLRRLHRRLDPSVALSRCAAPSRVHQEFSRLRMAHLFLSGSCVGVSACVAGSSPLCRPASLPTAIIAFGLDHIQRPVPRSSPKTAMCGMLGSRLRRCGARSGLYHLVTPPPNYLFKPTPLRGVTDLGITFEGVTVVRLRSIASTVRYVPDPETGSARIELPDPSAGGNSISGEKHSYEERAVRLA